MAVKEKKYFALLVLGLIGLFLFYAAIPLIAGIAGAAIFYVLFKPVYLKTLRKLGGRKTLSACLVMLLSVVIVIVPLSYLVYVGMVELGHFLASADELAAAAEPIAASLGYEGVADFLQAHADAIAEFVEVLTIIAISDTVAIAINVMVLYLILYYALTEHERAAATVREILPFSEKNASRLMQEFTHVIRTTVIGNWAASLVLGVLMAAGLIAVGMKNFFFWALVGTIAAFLPIVGIQLLWIPAGLYFIFLGDYFTAGAIVAWGAFLSYIADGYVRQLVQKHMGEMHPLISLLGLIVGITYFGIVGIIIGPLILAVFILLAKMFREEYVPRW